VNRLLHDALRLIIVSKDFREVVAALLDLTQQIFPVSGLEFYARDLDGRVLCLAPENRYKGAYTDVPEIWSALLDLERPADATDLQLIGAPDGSAVALPLFSPNSGRAEGIAVLHLSESVEIAEAAISALAEVSTPLEVAVERELLMRSVEVKRQELYDLAMRDALTGLHNRLFLSDAAERLFALQDRGDVKDVVVSMFDLDHFKLVNDTYGHIAGDEVLRGFGQVLASTSRTGDIVARIGGEEFVALHVMSEGGDEHGFADRVLDQTRRMTFDGELSALRITASAGTALRKSGEHLEAVVARADSALYDAKESGRDRVCSAPSADS
jgi:diguanylate cyclase (GGDEF)-like protein